MPARLKRYYGQGQLHFVTFSCYRRLALLGTARARNMFVKELSRVRREYGFLLVGYVVMPNHVHLLMSEPKKGTPSTVMQFVAEVPQFWQPRFYDFNVYSRKKKRKNWSTCTRIRWCEGS